MDLGLFERVAIVATASKGPGRAVAEELAREGAGVAICSRNPAQLQKAAAQIRKANGREVFWRPLNVGDSAAVTEFLAAPEDRFGRVDICVTKTGGSPSKMFAATTNEDWQV